MVGLPPLLIRMFITMPRKILVLNSGSSSIKYRLFAMDDGGRVLASGLIERIGESSVEYPVADHRQAMTEIVKRLDDGGHLRRTGLHAIGHRVVHGGESFSAAARVDDAVMQAIRAAIPLAPLHNPPNLLGMEICRELWPEVPQVAVFDTAFHQTLPPEAYRYAIPDICYREQHIRRYGFHGTSFAYVTRRIAKYLRRPRESLNLIALHLGNGASACAIRAGRSVDTSMGMTPLAGLMMGTRCGDLDPGVIFHWLNECGTSPGAVAQWLNNDSGLKGIAGVNDMRVVLAHAANGDPQARLAVTMYAYRIRHYIGAYLAILGRLDALIFTGGIGEHSAEIRGEICRPLGHLGLHLDETANREVGGSLAEIQVAGSGARIMVVPADEEGEIARQTADLLEGAGAHAGS
jgi:acetate kinase